MGTGGVWWEPPTNTSLYFNQKLIDTQLNTSGCSIWDTESQNFIDTTENCKGLYDFAHYLISGTIVNDTCYFASCENMPEGSECLGGTEISYHMRKCLVLIPTFQKDIEAYDYNKHGNIELGEIYQYQKRLPLVAETKYGDFEDVHIGRHYGDLNITYHLGDNKTEKLRSIVDDKKEHLFDIIEVNMRNADSYSNGVALW